ncbi:MAG: hypothetical protein CME62_11450 [Halobacteriovoraceae bacterium]|nr:hypothetical protein [Halobacteriovoraceae bacterium]|tara:strand:+ start:14481 stop:14705 length:225 start_codon:yes stop_codon:yes gene_type:complete
MILKIILSASLLLVICILIMHLMVKQSCVNQAFYLKMNKKLNRLVIDSPRLYGEYHRCHKRVQIFGLYRGTTDE